VAGTVWKIGVIAGKQNLNCRFRTRNEELKKYACKVTL
jgi:hypothetical protein